MPIPWMPQAAFPHEALEALKAEKLLGIMVPAALGGEEAGIADVADICYALGRACSSTGMIYAMHQVKAACIVRHGMDSQWHRDFMGRMVADQLLLASSTTEGKGGGNVRSSEAPVEHTSGRIVLVRDASVISYGAEADAVVTTARRDAPRRRQRPGAGRVRKEELRAGKDRRLGRAGHARHLQRRLQPEGRGRPGPDPAGSL